MTDSIQPETHDPSEPAPKEPDQIELECPSCAYLLAGLPEDRCPECGKDFDRAELTLDASAVPRPIHPWYESGLIGPFTETCLMTWFRPSQFAASFPGRHDSRSAWHFSLYCYALGFAIFMAPFAIRALNSRNYGFVQLLTIFAIASCFIFVVSIGCEIWIAKMLARRHTVPNIPRDQSYHFWRGITHFFGSFIILSFGAFILLVLLAPLATFPMWVLCLSRAVAARTPHQPERRTGTTILLFLIGIASIAVGAIAFYFGFGFIITMIGGP